MTTPGNLKEFICNGEIQKPVIFRNRVRYFECLKWTLNDWASKTRTVRLPFRFVRKDSCDEGPHWEGDADHVHARIADLIQWLESSLDDAENPLAKFSKEEYWCYSSYNHMGKVFKDNQEILQGVDWREFGFLRNGLESTFWVGTKGAYTPCHMDSYGCNLVAQLIGRKLWVLFPPEDSDFLYPTRIPYEESSVFSSVHIPKPSLNAHPNFTKCHPYVITLSPGDVLFVPHHWWHYVECEDVSVSVNTWIDLDVDRECRLHEAIAKTLMTAFVTTYEPNDELWLNPTEELAEPFTLEQQLKAALERIHTTNKEETEGDDHIATKRIKVASASKYLSGSAQWDFKKEEAFPVPHIQFEKLTEYFPNFSAGFSREETKSVVRQASVRQITMNKLLDCFTHENVIATIAKRLKDSFL